MSTQAKLQRQNERFELLLNLTSRITSNLDLRELLRTTSANIRDVVQADAAGVAFFDEESNKSRIYAVDFPDAKGFVKEELVVTPGHALKRAWESSKAVIVNTNDREELGAEIYDLVIAEGLDAHCLIPLVSRSRPVGLLILARKRQNLFSSEDVDFLTRASGPIAIAIENALVFQEVSGVRDRLRLLLNLTSRITSSLDLREVLRAIAANVREVIKADAVGVALHDAASGKFRVFAMDFPHGKGVVKEELLVTPGAAYKKAMDSLKPVVIDRWEPDELGPEIYHIAAAEGVKAACGIPLVNRGRFLGILSILRTTETLFTPEDVDFVSAASGQIAIAIENALAFREISELKEQLAQEKLYLEDEIRSEMNFAQIIGNSPSLRKVLKHVETVAPTDSTVLIYGETGTGKELIARAIHDLSPRRAKPFVKLNCAAIPTGLLESELFGHEKGAFTGAIAQRIGRFEVANGGTIFLDEIGEVPLELQTKLLRVLQEREFERLGSSRTLRTDARLIAATNRDLEAMVGEQKFRSDLFFRLNVFPMHVPPLRERQSDIPLLVRHFAQQFAKRMNKAIDTIPSATIDALCRYHWPGNIRELQNVIERGVITSTGPILRVEVADLKISKPPLTEKSSSSSSTNGALRDVLKETERQQILKALKQSNWVVAGPNGAAAKLGMNRSTLQLRMNKLGISRYPV
jgi:formate hydrogenlyase transcriptional activator